MNSNKENALKSIFKGGSIVFLGLVLSKLFSLVFRVLVGRYLGPTEYGIITLMTAVFSTAAGLSTLGLPLGVQKYVSEYRGEGSPRKIRGTIQAGLSIVTISSTIIGGAIILLAPWLAVNIFGEPQAVLPLRMVGLIIPLRAWHDILTNITDAFEKMQYEVYSERIYSSIVKVSLTIILVSLGFNYIGAAFGYAFALGSTVFISFYFTNKTFSGILDYTAPAERNYKELFSHSWPLFAGSLIGILTGNIDSFTIQYFIGSESLGIYQAAFPFAILLLVGKDMFSSIFLSNASKIVSNDESAEIIELYTTLTKWISLVSVPMFLILFVFPKPVLSIFGPEYHSATTTLRILSLGFLASAVVGPANNMYQAVEKTKLNLYTSIATGLFNLLLNLLLVPRYGIVGAALATSTTFIIVGTIHLLLINKIAGVKPFKKSLLKIWFSGTTAVLVIYSLNNTVFESATPLWALIPNLIAFGIIYGLLLLASRSLDKEDILILKAIREKLGMENSKIEKFLKRFT